MSSTYGFSTYGGRDFDHAIEIVTKELKKQGFGLVTDIDMQAIFRQKLAVEADRYRILGVCNPWVAYEALRNDPDIGLLLPCNIVVREDKDGAVTVAFTAPEAILGLVNRADLVKLSMEVRRRLEKVRDVLASEINHIVA